MILGLRTVIQSIRRLAMYRVSRNIQVCKIMSSFPLSLIKPSPETSYTWMLHLCWAP